MLDMERQGCPTLRQQLPSNIGHLRARRRPGAALEHRRIAGPAARQGGSDPLLDPVAGPPVMPLLVAVGGA